MLSLTLFSLFALFAHVSAQRGGHGGRIIVGSHSGGGEGGDIIEDTRIRIPPSANSSALTKTPLNITFNGKKYSAIPTGSGEYPKSVIPSKEPFGGREIGGADFWDVAGTSVYGSGYPGLSGRGVEGRGFPYIFFPVVWPSGSGPSYLYREQEYETANSPRPGGPLQHFSIIPAPAYDWTKDYPTYSFRLIADTATVEYFRSVIPNACPGANVSSPAAYNTNIDQRPYPLPQEAIQYYRASSVVLTVDGFNNTATWLMDNDTMSYLPETVNLDLKNCLNDTIVRGMPLVEPGSARSSSDANLDWQHLHREVLLVPTLLAGLGYLLL